jgi:mRNA-degrading endonuclease YafQ of YafQ-DinJ toxin-antitoxin module
MLKITFTERFKKHFRGLSANEKKQFRSKLAVFAENPLHPSLRTKRIQGTDDLYEFSVNMDIRVIWFYEGDALVALVDIGHHDILRKY